MNWYITSKCRAEQRVKMAQRHKQADVGDNEPGRVVVVVIGVDCFFLYVSSLYLALGTRDVFGKHLGGK